MTRILVVETASPARVLQKVQELLDASPDSEITVLCLESAKTTAAFARLERCRIVTITEETREQVIADLGRSRFDIQWVFWTGEKSYRKMKQAAWQIRSGATFVDTGDGGSFRVTWKALIRFALFRFRHPLPTDHYVFVPHPLSPGSSLSGREKILIVQSAEPPYILRALNRMEENHLFRDPIFTVFCRNRPEIVRAFEGHPRISAIRTHSETRDSFKHWRELRRERFDGLIVFFTGDPSYWKIKYMAFLLGVRHKVVFNENNDCYFFAPGPWLAALANRFGVRSREQAQRFWSTLLRQWLMLLLKLILLPFRFVWLLGVWVRLRAAR